MTALAGFISIASRTKSIVREGGLVDTTQSAERGSADTHEEPANGTIPKAMSFRRPRPLDCRRQRSQRNLGFLYRRPQFGIAR